MSAANDSPNPIRSSSRRSETTRGCLPIELTYDFEDTDIAEGDPARLAVALCNTGDAPVTIESDPPWPFDVPVLLREDTDEYRRIAAWNDALADSEYLTTCDRTVVSWEETFVEADLDACETVSETYEIYYDSPGIAAGTRSSFVAARARDENAAESHTIFFDEIVSNPSATSESVRVRYATGVPCTDRFKAAQVPQPWGRP